MRLLGLLLPVVTAQLHSSQLDASNIVNPKTTTTVSQNGLTTTTTTITTGVIPVVSKVPVHTVGWLPKIDTRGCIGGAGYEFCEAWGLCIDTNIISCPTTKSKPDKWGCYSGTTWCATWQQCIATSKTCPGKLTFNTDSHGCNIGLGSTWCEALHMCTDWSTPCNTAVVWDNSDSHGCLLGSGYVWCEAMKGCIIPSFTTCEAIPGGKLTAGGCVAGYTWCALLNSCVRTTAECAAPTVDVSVVDAHGCIVGAGNKWCAAYQQCVPAWDFSCPTVTDLGGKKDAHGCATGAGYKWCEFWDRCYGPSETCPTEAQAGKLKKDANGCETGLGYEWCASRQKCFQPWVESCLLGVGVAKKG